MANEFVRFGISLLAICLLGSLDTTAAAPSRCGCGQKAAQAASARRQATIQAAQAQIAAAQSVLSAAEFKGGNAQALLQLSLGKLQNAAIDVNRAQETAQSLLAELLRIEREILSEQSVDTEYFKLREGLNAAKRELAAARAEVLERAEVARDLQSLNVSDRVAETDKRLRMSPRYLRAHDQFVSIGKELERVKLDLFRADIDWKQTNQALVAVRHEISVAKGEIAAAGFSRLRPLKEYREASQVAGIARAAIAEAEGILRSLDAATTNAPSSNISSANK